MSLSKLRGRKFGFEKVNDDRGFDWSTGDRFYGRLTSEVVMNMIASKDEQGDTVSATGPSKAGRWAKRLGVIAFLFFFIKGLAWLAVPAALAVMAMR